MIRNSSDSYRLSSVNDAFRGSGIKLVLTFSPSELRKIADPYLQAIPFKNADGKTFVDLKVRYE
jgi:hypothetical protein